MQPIWNYLLLCVTWLNPPPPPPLIRHIWITPAAHSYKQCMFFNWFNRSKATLEVKFNWTKSCLVEHIQAELQSKRQTSRIWFMKLVGAKYFAVNRKWILISQDFKWSFGRRYTSRQINYKRLCFDRIKKSSPQCVCAEWKCSLDSWIKMLHIIFMRSITVSESERT